MKNPIYLDQALLKVYMENRLCNNMQINLHKTKTIIIIQEFKMKFKQRIKKFNIKKDYIIIPNNNNKLKRILFNIITITNKFLKIYFRSPDKLLKKIKIKFRIIINIYKVSNY